MVFVVLLSVAVVCTCRCVDVVFWNCNDYCSCSSLMVRGRVVGNVFVRSVVE